MPSASNESAIGARVDLTYWVGEMKETMTRVVTAGSGWGSQGSTTADFGLGTMTKGAIYSLEVTWPSGICYSVPSSDYELNEVYILLEDKWLAWPGGQSNTDLNPQELFTSEEMGLGDVAVDWNVGNGGTSAKIVWADGSAFGPATSATGKKQIKVRYDTKSDNNTQAKAVKIEATKGEGDSAVTEQEYRTVFKITWDTAQITGNLNANNKLQFPDWAGFNRRTCEFNWVGTRGSNRVCGKVSCTANFSPSGIDWTGKGVDFEYGKGSEGNKYQCRTAREIRYADGYEGEGVGYRAHQYEDWKIDNEPDDEDCQYPTAKDEEGNIIDNDRAFRIDAPSMDPEELIQLYMRDDFRDFFEWHDGSAWVRCSYYSKWHINATGTLDECTEGTPSNQGADYTSHNAPNSKPTANAGDDQDNIPVGTEDVQLDGSGSTDPDHDLLTYNWTPPDGITLDPNNTAEAPTFDAPSEPETLSFKLEVRDGTQQLGEYAPNPDNSESEPDYVEVEVVSE